jgi:NAD(P)-dependent dehydrogenase (short-subunit alcohol dehydrogenase family)
MAKTIVITGGSSGIGYALAAHYLALGWQVAICARNPDTLAQAAAYLIPSATGKLFTYPADVSSLQECIQFSQAVAIEFGPADVVVCNAGISMRALFAETDMAVIRSVMEINFFGTLHTTKAFLDQLSQTKGTLVAVSSIAGYRGLPGRLGYSASKAALNAALESLRLELAPSNIHVLNVSPGFTTSSIRERALLANGDAQGSSPIEEGQAMPAPILASKMAQAIADRKRDLILTSQGRFTIWLNRLFPSLADRLIRRFYQKEGTLPL